ncbi:MAG: ribonuclease P protein component [Cyanobacteria bacterium J06641_5]
MSLPAVHRLRDRRDFRRVYGRGTKHHSRHLILRALAPTGVSPAREPTQVGITVGRKVSRRAVVRNRIKRRIRAGLRLLLPKTEPGWKLVAVVKPEAIGCTYADFLQELEQLLAKAGIWHGD